MEEVKIPSVIPRPTGEGAGVPVANDATAQLTVDGKPLGEPSYRPERMLKPEDLARATNIPIASEPERIPVAAVGVDAAVLKKLVSGVATKDVAKFVDIKVEFAGDKLWYYYRVQHPDGYGTNPYFTDLEWHSFSLSHFPKQMHLRAMPSDYRRVGPRNDVEIPVEYPENTPFGFAYDPSSKYPDGMSPTLGSEIARFLMTNYIPREDAKNADGAYVGVRFPVFSHVVNQQIFEAMQPFARAYIRHGRRAYRKWHSVAKAFMQTEKTAVVDFPEQENWENFYFTEFPGVFIDPGEDHGPLQTREADTPIHQPGLFSEFVERNPDVKERYRNSSYAWVLHQTLPYSTEGADPWKRALENAMNMSPQTPSDADAIASGISERGARDFMQKLIAATHGCPMAVVFPIVPTITDFIHGLLLKLLPGHCFSEQGRLNIDMCLHRYMVNNMRTGLENAQPRVDMLDYNPWGTDPDYPTAPPGERYHFFMRGRPILAAWVTTWGDSQSIAVPGQFASVMPTWRQRNYRVQLLGVSNPMDAKPRILQFASVIGYLIDNSSSLWREPRTRNRNVSVLTYFKAALVPKLTAFFYGVNVVSESIAKYPLLMTSLEKNSNVGYQANPRDFLSAMLLLKRQDDVEFTPSLDWIRTVTFLDMVLSLFVSHRNVYSRFNLPLPYTKFLKPYVAAAEACKDLLIAARLDFLIPSDAYGTTFIRALDFSPFVSRIYDYVGVIPRRLKELYEAEHMLPNFFMCFSPLTRREVGGVRADGTRGHPSELNDRNGGPALCFTMNNLPAHLSPYVATLTYEQLQDHFRNRTWAALVQRATMVQGYIMFNFPIRFTLKHITSRDESYKVRDMVPAPFEYVQGPSMGQIMLKELVIPFAFRHDISDWDVSHLGPEDFKGMFPLYVPNIAEFDPPGLRFTNVRDFITRHTQVVSALDITDDVKKARFNYRDPMSVVKTYSTLPSLAGTAL